MQSDTITLFFEKLTQSILDQSFVKLTLAKPNGRGEALNIYGKTILIKGQEKLSLTYRFPTNDKVENFSIPDSVEELTQQISFFSLAILFTTKGDTQLKVNKKRIASLHSTKAAFSKKPSLEHDKQKQRPIETSHAEYLKYLGIIDASDKLVPSMADKYKQINKFIEIVSVQLKNTALNEQKEFRIVDMGSGKGYLTFALYDYLANKEGKIVHIEGIESRKDLVDLCNDIAQKCNFGGLSFSLGKIQDYQTESLDILIALHACDTATDDAIYKGIQAHAKLIICAPCCHKEIRKQIKPDTELAPILKHGIFEERQAEMLTDGIRALLLETKGYQRLPKQSV